MSASPLEVRMAHLDGSYERINHRLGSLETRMANVERKIDESEDSIVSTMETRFNWVMGLILASILLPVVERFIR